MTLLSETAHVLTHTHKRHTVTEDGDVWGDEPALLDILAGCVASTTSSRAGGGGNGGKAAPVDLGALDLWQQITRVIDTCWPGNGDPAYVRVPTTIKLNAWVTHTTDPAAEGVLLDLCRRWVTQIREAIEPTRKIPVPNVACPVCGWDRTVTEEDGEFTYRPALIAYPEAQPVRIVCTVAECSGEWSGPEVADTFMKTLTVDSVFM